MSRFLRDYLYIPHGREPARPGRQLLALLATMTLGGPLARRGPDLRRLGRGAWARARHRLLWRKSGRPMPTFLGIAFTFSFVALAWVLFQGTELRHRPFDL